jgi:hypothetical protein
VVVSLVFCRSYLYYFAEKLSTSINSQNWFVEANRQLPHTFGNVDFVKQS